jgi:hypothetical protein
VAPGRADEVKEQLSHLKVTAHRMAHNCLTLYSPDSVVTYLLHSAPTKLMVQALEEYLTACKLVPNGAKVPPEVRDRQIQAVRAVLALCPPAWSVPFRRGRMRKDRPPGS